MLSNKELEKLFLEINSTDAVKVDGFVYRLSFNLGCDYAILGLNNEDSKRVIALSVVPEISLKRGELEKILTSTLKEMQTPYKLDESFGYYDNIFPYVEKSINIDLKCSKDVIIYLGKEEVPRKFDDKLDDLKKENITFSILYRSKYHEKKFNKN